MLDTKKYQKAAQWAGVQQELIVRAMKDESFRQELLANSKSVVEREMGKLKEEAKLPAGILVKVIEQPDKYPDTKFVILDGTPHPGNDYSKVKVGQNTVSVHFAEHEAGFLAGVAD